MKTWMIPICNKCEDRVTEDGWCYTCEKTLNSPDYRYREVCETGRIQGTKSHMMKKMVRK